MFLTFSIGDTNYTSNSISLHLEPSFVFSVDDTNCPLQYTMDILLLGWPTIKNYGIQYFTLKLLKLLSFFKTIQNINNYVFFIKITIYLSIFLVTTNFPFNYSLF